MKKDYLENIGFDEIHEGPQGEPGLDGEQGEKGDKGDKGERGDIGPPGIAGRNGLNGTDGRDGVDGRDGRDGSDGKDGSPDTPYQIAEKLNTTTESVDGSVIKGWNQLKLSTESRVDPRLNIGVNKIIAGSNISITSSYSNGKGDVVISSTASGGLGGSGYQAPLSGGLTGTNTWTTAPNVIVVDQGRTMQKVSVDGTVNWTGTTVTVLSVAPNNDIFAVA